MAEFNGENNFGGVFGGVEFKGESAGKFQGNIGGEVAKQADETVFKKVEADSLPAKQSVWTKIRSFLFQEIDLYAPIKVELTPYQQKVEDEINEFLHQEVTFKGFFNLFKKN